MRVKGVIISAAAVAALGAGGAAMAGATGGGDDGADRAITGPALAKAGAAALSYTGGGKVTGSEVGDEESWYEVEVTRGDGSQVDVQLDRGFHVVGSKADHEDASVAAAQGGDFTTTIDNPYMPLRVGMTWVYRETAADGTVQRDVVKVTNRTKRVASGVTARVVRDTVTEKGKLVEDTFDWYAQDGRGNVWYLGEDTKEYAHGKVSSTEGSWEAGVDGARAGIVMLAHPRAGRQYRQEHYPGHAEDTARVLSRDDQVEVPAGHYRPTLLTKEWNPLEPRTLEYKAYARGVGVVLELGVSGDLDRAELLRFRR